MMPFFNIYGHRHNSIDEFFHNFPGNTSNFSDAVRKGIDAAVKQYYSEKYREVLTESQLQVCFTDFVRVATNGTSIAQPTYQHQ